MIDKVIGSAYVVIKTFIYHIFPEAAQKALARIQFWLFNVGLPIMLLGIADNSIGTGGIVLVAVGATITSIAILLFAISVLTGVKNEP